MESPSQVLLESYYNMIRQFPCTAGSFTPIQVVTKEVRYIHALSLTLESSMPMSSPAVPGLTSPRALRSRVLQASSASEDVHRVLLDASGFSYSVLESFERFDQSSEYFPGCIEAMRCFWPRISSSDMVRDVLALHMEQPPSLRLNRRIRLRVISWSLGSFFKKVYHL